MKRKLIFVAMMFFSIVFFLGCEDTNLSTVSLTDELTTSQLTTNEIETTENNETIDEQTTVDLTSEETTTIEVTTVEITTELPTTIEPTTVEPTTVEPTTIEPTTVEPTTVEPTTVEPTTIEPTTIEPTTVEPTTIEPTTIEPTTVELTTVEPTTIEPTTVEPTTVEPTTTENPIDQLFFSEYIEGSSYNKAVEIFNGTGSAIDLSNYSVKVFGAGNQTPRSVIQLSGTIENNDVFVLAHSSATAAIMAEADMTDGTLDYNGDDAVGLFYNDVLVDVIGNIGSSDAFAKDVTIVRKDTVFAPTTYYQSSEWDEYSTDTFTYLGSHADVNPDDSTLLAQDVAQLPDSIVIYGVDSYDFGTGDNGSTYTITNVTGDASSYVTYSNALIESSLTEDMEYLGVIYIEVSLDGVGTETTTVLLSVRLETTNTNYDTDTHPEYYTSITEGLTGSSLEEALRTLISDYTYVSYDDARYILDESDADQNNPGNVILVYTQDSVSGVWDYGTTWNREHVWPQSLLGYDSIMTSDLHNLKPSDPTENGYRGNKYFDNLMTAATYEPPDEVKGDIARIIFYMAVRFNLDLVNTAPSTYEMGLLDVLISWHIQDPVDDFELNRNNVIYSYQHNRNPFIDHPEYVALIWG
jgi:endonuclease I